MEKILNHLDKVEIKSFRLTDFDIIISKKRKIVGIALMQDIICRAEKPLFSFRLKIENITDLKDFVLLSHKKCSIDRNYLEQYFAENNDNPYGIELIFQILKRGQNITSSTLITQFPPLGLKNNNEKTESKFKVLISKMRAADLLFTSEISSNISKLVRDIDFCPFSHVYGVYNNSGIIQSMTTSGIERGHISMLLDPTKYNIALYRPFPEYSDREILEYQNRKDKQVVINPKYDWVGVIKIFLYKKYKFMRWCKPKFSKRITGFDMVYANNLKLIDYV